MGLCGNFTLNNNYKLKFTKLKLSTNLSPLQRPFFCTWLLFSGWLSLHDFLIFFYYLDSSHSLNIITTVFLGDLSTYKFAAILHEIQVTLSADVSEKKNSFYKTSPMCTYFFSLQMTPIDTINPFIITAVPTLMSHYIGK